jgi:hypothetical protein
MRSRPKVGAKKPAHTHTAGKRSPAKSAAKKSQAAGRNALRDFRAASTNAPRDADTGQRSYENNPRAIVRDTDPSRNVAPRRG